MRAVSPLGACRVSSHSPPTVSVQAGHQHDTQAAAPWQPQDAEMVPQVGKGSGCGTALNGAELLAAGKHQQNKKLWNQSWFRPLWSKIPGNELLMSQTSTEPANKPFSHWWTENAQNGQDWWWFRGFLSCTQSQYHTGRQQPRARDDLCVAQVSYRVVSISHP